MLWTFKIMTTNTLIKNNTMKIFVTSENPVKIEAAKEVFGLLHSNGIIRAPVITYECQTMPSGVGHTPLNELIKEGAANRAMEAHNTGTDADYIVSFEGGVQYKDREALYCTAFCCVLRTSDMKAIFAKAPAILLPQTVRDLIHEGIELGPAMDQVFDLINSKQQDGAIGTLTHGAVKRIDTYSQMLAIAAAPFFHQAYAELNSEQ